MAGGHRGEQFFQLAFVHARNNARFVKFANKFGKLHHIEHASFLGGRHGPRAVIRADQSLPLLSVAVVAPAPDAATFSNIFCRVDLCGSL